MKTSAFLDLISDESLEKIDIDPKLIPAFKGVIRRMHDHFEKNGYLEQRDYHALFKKHLLDGELGGKKYSIRLNDEPRKIGAAGFYTTSRICIDESNMRKQEIIEHALCHEFIHFLVMQELSDSDPDGLWRRGFINEALTEMLTREMYPERWAYEPQVRMLEFANTLTGNENNYEEFLRGGVDAKRCTHQWRHFLHYTSLYQSNFGDKGYRMETAATDKNYLSAQKELIAMGISTHSIDDINEYLEKLKFLECAPIPSDESVAATISAMDENLLNALSKAKGLVKTDDKLKAFLAEKLSEIKGIEKRLDMYDGEDVYEFEFMGRTIAVGRESIHGAVGIQRMTMKGSDEITFMNSQNIEERITIDKGEIDFEARKKGLLSEKEELVRHFSERNSVKKVVSMAERGDDMIRLERYALPNISNGRDAGADIYIAHYPDRIEVLDERMRIGMAEDVQLTRFIGLTSRVNGLISADKTRVLDEGYVFSTLSAKALRTRIIAKMSNELLGKSEEEILEMVSEYRKIGNDIEEDPVDEKYVKEYAAQHFAEAGYEEMEEAERGELERAVFGEYPQFIVSSNEGVLEVSAYRGGQVAFTVGGETLVDLEGEAAYNELYAYMYEPQKLKDQVIRIGRDGNLEMPQKEDRVLEDDDEVISLPFDISEQHEGSEAVAGDASDNELDY